MLRPIRLPGPLAIRISSLALRRTRRPGRPVMETNSPDPGGLVHVFVGAVIAAAAKWLWDRLVKTARPARTEHSSAFLLSEVRQIRDAIDGVAGTVQGMEDRINRLEQRSRHRPASTSTD